MSKIIEAKAIISAADKTGAVFDQIAKKMKGLASTGKSMEQIKPLKFTGNLMEELNRLKLTEKELQKVRNSMAAFQNQLAQQPVRAAHYFRAMDDWKDRTVAHWRAIKAGVDETEKSHKRFFAGASRWAATGAAYLGGVYGAYRVGKAGVTAAATSQRESARDYLAGMPASDSKRIEDAAVDASRRYQSVDSQTMHERLRDTAMGMRSTNKALELVDTIGQMTTVLQSLKGKDQAIEEGRKFFAALDVLGRNLDPKEVKELADGYVKALGVEGADMNLGGVLAMSKRLKAAGATVSNRFLMTTGVGLGRDMGDERAGNAISMMMQQEVQATEQAKAYGKKHGLRDKSGKFVDRSRMMSDPDRWAWEDVSAAMRRAKLDPNKAEDVNTFLQGAYSNSNARDVISKLMTQREQYEGKAEQFGRAPGLAAAGPMMGKDPFVAYEAVFAQLRTLAGQAPIMDSTAQGLNALSGAIAGLNEAVKNSGDWIKDGVKSATDKVKNWWENETRDAKAIGGAVKGVLDWDKKWSVNPSYLGLGPKADNSYPQAEDPMGADYSRRQFHSKEYWKGLGRENQALGAAAQRFTPPSFPVPGVSDTMTYGTGVGGNQSIGVHGEVTGTIEGKFTAVAGDSLVKLVEDTQQLNAEVRGALSRWGANGVGTTGKSSPDAIAP